MTVLAAAWAWLKRAWLWVKTHWQWLVLPVGAVLWLLGRLTAGKKPVVVADGEIVGHDLVQASEDAKAAQLVAQADALEQAKLQGIASGQSAAQSALVTQVKQEAAAVEADPEKVNELLLKVGKDMRK